MRLLLFSYLLLCLGVGVWADETRPNIVLILVDDMGYGDPGCFNPESKISTPHIDSLALSGMRFTDAHAPGPLCHMSRYGLLTGRYPFRTDVTRWPTQPLIEPGQMTIATLAKQAGYRTAMVGKWHLGFREQGLHKRLPGGPIDCGFDSFHGIRASTDIPPYFYIRDDRAVQLPTETIDEHHSEDWSPIQGEFYRAGRIAPNLKLEEVLPVFTNVAVETIKRHANSRLTSRQPLMLYVAYAAPHTPWLPAASFKGKSGAGMYGDFVTMVDTEVGRILTALEEAEMTDDTLVIFTSDNGPVWYEKDKQRFGHDSAGGLRGMKGDAWEAGHRMPMIVRWPGHVAKNSTSDQLICFTDFLATFASIMDIDLPETAGPDSFDFASALFNEASDQERTRDHLVIQTGSRNCQLIRQGDWKLIAQLGSGGFSRPSHIDPIADGPEGQLYNLARDPDESENLYLMHPEIVARLTDTLQQTVATEPSRLISREIKTKATDRNTLHEKVMCGYQGWFTCEGDGAETGWKHWAAIRKKPFAPGNVTVDLWPDVSEYSSSELYDTGFKHADGSTAKVFSSWNRDTVRVHFRWMQEYGIDGAFVQRFANELRDSRMQRLRNTVLQHAGVAAEEMGRSFVVMYDLSGLPAGGVQIVHDDWRALRNEMKITENPAYQYHRGKPVVAVWGVGFSGKIKSRKYSLKECQELVSFLKEDGCTVMLGVPTGWRQGKRDATSDPLLHETLQMADIVSPWTVGRYRKLEEVDRHAKEYWRLDKRWCNQHKLDYMPVIFPGFSWHNLKGEELNSIPRQKGKFFWSQVVGAMRARSDMLYIAMFDEVDEGTAIFKCTNNPPTANGARFSDLEGLPSDFYLRLAGQAGKVLRREERLKENVPH